MKKRIILILLACLLLTGCSRQKTVGLCLAQKSLWAELEAPLKAASYQVEVENAGLDQAVQERQLAELLEEGPDLVILEPVMTAQTPALADQCAQAGVPVLFVGHDPAGEALSGKGTAHVGLQTESAGIVQGQLASQLPGADLNGDGVISYAILAGPETDLDAAAITESCQAALSGNCLGVYYGGWTEGEQSGSKLLSTWGKDLEVVLCNSEDLALGAMEAMEDGGRTVGADIFLVSIGSTQMDKLLVKSGDLSGTVTPDMDGLKALVLDTARQLMAGKATEKQQYGNYVPITKENVEEYLDEKGVP